MADQQTTELDRVAYTRHATHGPEDDLIRSAALVNFWKTMTALGGAALLWLIASTSYCVGHQGVTTVATPAPVVTPPAPVPQPQVVVLQVPTPQPVQQVAYPPAVPVANQPTQVEPRPLSDTERRNKALEDRLRRKYGHTP